MAINFPIIIKPTPTLVANELVDVKPLSYPSGIIYGVDPYIWENWDELKKK